MELFNIISGVCSIIGLAVSLFTASKVIKMSFEIKCFNHKDQSEIENHIKGTSVGGDIVGRDKNVGK